MENKFLKIDDTAAGERSCASAYSVGQKKERTGGAAEFEDNRKLPASQLTMQRVAADTSVVQKRKERGGFDGNRHEAAVGDGVGQRVAQRVNGVRNGNKKGSAPVYSTYTKTSDTVQRAFDTSSFLKTKNGQYMVDSARDKYLFSKEDADAPMPTGLYHMKTDQESTSKAIIKVWIPNVKFTSQTERAFIAKSKTTGAGKFTKKKTFGKDEHLDLTPKMDSVSSVNTPKGYLPATTGAFGKNDCNVFATRLQNMIAHEKMVTQGGLNYPKPVRKIANTSTASKEELKVGVGDKMVHMYPKTEKCKYHAATIVAKDGPSTVTLEGHVSKDLEKPQFHIRNGVKGFVKDNDTKVVSHLFGSSTKESRGLGGKVEISPLESVLNPESEKKRGDQRYNIIRGREDGFDVTASATVMGQDMGTTDTDSPVLRATALEIAEELAGIYGWATKTTREFSTSAECLKKARIRLGNKKKPTPSYIF